MEVKFDNVNYDVGNAILNNINIQFKESKITSIVGKSGSGKTTIAELSNGLVYPTDGIIKVGSFAIDKKGIKNDKDINKLRVNVGLVFQIPEEQFFNTTVKEEISFGIKYFKYKNSDIDKRVSDALKMVGLDDSYLERNPFTLSNGEKRKVAIASILVFNQKILILDEPTIGLDANSQKNLLQLIRKLKVRSNKTIVIISHDMDLVHSISDYIYVLNEGKIVLEGEKYQLFKQEEELKNY